MPRGFGVGSYTALVIGKGHQAPPWETWASEMRVGPIPVLEMTENIDNFEKKFNKVCPPGLVSAYARQQGLAPSPEMVQELLEERKVWREHKALPEPEPSPDHFHLDIEAMPPEGGAVNPSSGDFPPGDLLLTAKPNADYLFDHWGGDTSGTDKQITIVLDDDKNITAHFEGKVG